MECVFVSAGGVWFIPSGPYPESEQPVFIGPFSAFRGSFAVVVEHFEQWGWQWGCGKPEKWTTRAEITCSRTAHDLGSDRLQYTLSVKYFTDTNKGSGSGHEITFCYPRLRRFGDPDPLSLDDEIVALRSRDFRSSLRKQPALRG